LPLFRRSTNPRVFGDSSRIVPERVRFNRLWIEHLLDWARLSGDEFGAQLISQSSADRILHLE
jgi:hypothetical protein